MFHSRKSRESKAIDSEAFAAASAIGRALDARGTKVDTEKLPRYNSVSRSNSMVRSPSMSSRNNSLRTRRDSRRASSLQLRTPRQRESIDEGEFYDAEDTFQAFGGAQAQTKPVTVKKYVPGPSGLRLVEVPISEVQKPPSRSTSFNRRSVSINSGLSARKNSLGRRSSLNSQSSQNKKVSAPIANKKQESVRRSTKITRSSKPLAEQSLQEETDEQLKRDGVAKEAGSPIISVSSSTGAGRETPTSRTSEITSKSIPTSSSTNESQTQVPPKVLISPPREDNEETQIAVEPKSTPTSMNQDGTTATVNPNSTPIDANESMKSTDTGTNRTVDDVIREKESKSNHTSTEGPSQDAKVAVVPAETSGHSMAKYLRSANQYLNKAHEKTREKIEENVSPVEANERASPAEINGASPMPEGSISRAKPTEMPPITKTSSPMKSALKKTASNNSLNKSYRKGPDSKASDAYISLATAENTRLNAQLLNENPKRYSTTRKARPSSVANGATTAQKSTPTASKLKHRSVQIPNRAQVQPPARSNLRPETSRQGQQPKPGVRTQAAGTKQDKSAFYPPEPPQKRSSFEKVRPSNSHMGFKMLSLRSEVDDEVNELPALGAGSQNGPRLSTNGPEPTKPQTPLNVSGHGWSSRFHDSDSDGEEAAAPFHAPPITTKQPEKSSGFSFKSKKDKILAPPQPQFAQSTTAPNSKHNTPHKKISTLSLRSVSNHETAPTKTDNNLSNRFFSEQLPPGHKDTDSIKKKSSFGKKLKKIFGRKK